jgi:hypothetical protein
VSSAHRKLRAVSLVLALAATLPAPARAESLRRLEYRVAWNGIPAASGVVTITPGDAGGRETLVVDASARTNALVSLLWSFSGSLQATMLADGPTPQHFDYRRDINGRPHATTIDFDGTRAHGVYEHGGGRREADMPADVVDPVTAAFRARASQAGPGDALWYDVWTGEVRYTVRLDVKARETVDVPAGRFAALRVVPHLWRIAGRAAPDTRLRRATIWVTDDPRHVPLRIRSKVFIGAVNVDLVDFDPRG